jgi:hypothetical protein
MVGANERSADLRASPACATTTKLWSSTNRVLYVRLPCPSVPTSCSKVLADEVVVPDGTKPKRWAGRFLLPDGLVEEVL